MKILINLLWYYYVMSIFKYARKTNELQTVQNSQANREDEERGREQICHKTT